MSEATTKLDAMTKDERSLLLYLESRAVDSGGVVDTLRMNAADMKIAKRWFKEGFVGFTRLLSAYTKKGPTRELTHAVQLLPLAFECAALERMRRAVRTISPEVIESLEHFGCMAAALAEEMVPSGPAIPA